MPITSSAKKAAKQNIKQRIKNFAQKSTLKKAIKDAKKLLSEGKAEVVKGQLPKLYQLIDKAVKRNIFHKNNAAHKKSTLAKAVGSAEKKS